MKLTVITHKACWKAANGDWPVATTGGFPDQFRALSELFDETRLVAPVLPSPTPPGAVRLTGKDASCLPLDALPLGKLRRRAQLVWLPRNLPKIWRSVREADAVHAVIPGDIGTIGLLVALAQRKPLFVRHCGDWWHRNSVMLRFWPWLMETTAGRRNVMFATGFGREPPSKRNPAIHRIFASRLSKADLEALRPSRPRQPARDPRLLAVGRQVAGKGTRIVIDSLPRLIEYYPSLQLDIVGDGPLLPDLKDQAQALHITDRVRFHGQVTPTRVLEFMHQADVLCHPTESEGFSKTVIEAMGCGLPIVTSSVSGLPELLHDCGIAMVERTPEALSCAVLACLSDPGQYATMSSNAIHQARHYTTEKWQDRIREVLESAWGPLRGA